MTLSIIIPIYNREEYLSDTLDSVLAQTFTDFEVILIDDGSTDQSPAICDRYAAKDSRIKVIHKQNEGVSEARNTGVQLAKGDYIGFVDSDDIIEPCMFSLMIEASKKYNCDIIQCEHDRADTVSNIPYEITDDNFTVSTGHKVVGDIFVKQGDRCTNILALWSKIYKRELFDGIVFPKGRVYEDEARTYQLILKTDRIGELDLPLYHYIERGGSIITGIAINKCLDKAWALHDKVEFFRGKDNDFFTKSVIKYFNYLKSTYVQMYNGTVIYKNEDKIIRRLFRESYSDFNAVADKYDKIYLKMICWNIGTKWILKHDFAPIQHIVAKFKR